MQDIEAEATGGTVTTLYVCVTCRTEGDVSDVRAGRRLFDSLASDLAQDATLAVVPVECLSVCRRPCTVALATPGKWTYVYGDFPAETSSATIIEAARLYAAAPDGLIPWKLRSDPIKRGVVSRVPPFTAAPSGQAA